MRAHAVTNFREVEAGPASVLAHTLRVATMGNLVASIAHELCQPLTAVLTNAQAAEAFLACDPPNLVEVREIVGEIIEDERRASELIRRLWSMLKNSTIELVDVDLNDVVDEVCKIVQNDARMKRVTLDRQRAPDLPVVRGDRIQLQQVMLNLVVNGIDAMARPDIADRRLSIRTTVTDRRAVRVEVTDRGAGIEPSNLGRIFEPYFTTKSHGLGMGLAIARSIAESHRGELAAMNSGDLGATFVLTLPPAF